MKLDAVAVVSSDIPRSMEFYKIIGFKFPDYKESEGHVESIPKKGEARLMIDSVEIMTGIIGFKPAPSNHSSFAVQLDSPAQVNETSQKLDNAGFTIFKEPWDAFWGQRYAIAQDPDGYKVDLYAPL